MAHTPIGMILAAGFGSRLAPLSLRRPKPAMDLAGRPIIYHLIRMLEKAGIKDIIINTHYRPDRLMSAISGLKISSRLHPLYEKQILGTAGGVANALRRFDISDRPMMVLHGDILCAMDLGPMLADESFCTLICAQDKEIAGYVGSVGVDHRDRIVELGKYYCSSSDAAKRGFFTGIQILSREAVGMIKRSNEGSLVADLYPRWLRENRVMKAIIRPLRYDDLGTADRIYEANLGMLRHPSLFERFGFFENLDRGGHGQKTFLGKGVRIHPDAVLVEPFLIGDHSVIENGARIGPWAIIGRGCRIEENARVMRSLVLSREVVAKDRSLDCVILTGGDKVLVKAER